MILSPPCSNCGSDKTFQAGKHIPGTIFKEVIRCQRCHFETPVTAHSGEGQTYFCPTCPAKVRKHEQCPNCPKGTKYKT